MVATFRRAQREQIKIKIALTGPAGSGKSEGALALARQLVGPQGAIAALDTENRALSLYADRYGFDVIDLAPPYESRFFAEAIDAAVAGGYDALVIDSLSHEWEGEGSILDRKQKKEKALGVKANGFALWAEFKAEHRSFMTKLVNAPIHIIACFRAREEYAQSEEGGKKRVEKLGFAPVTGEGAEYEFRVVFALNMEHVATTSKDNTGLFDGRYTNLLHENPGGRLAKWLASGAAATTPATRPADAPASDAAPAQPAATAEPEALRFPRTFPVEALRSRRVGKCSLAELETAYGAVKDGESAGAKKWAAILEEELEQRRADAAVDDEAGMGETSAALTADAAAEDAQVVAEEMAAERAAAPDAEPPATAVAALPDPIAPGASAAVAEMVGQRHEERKAQQLAAVAGDAGDGLPF